MLWMFVKSLDNHSNPKNTADLNVDFKNIETYKNYRKRVIDTVIAQDDNYFHIYELRWGM